MAKTKDLTGYKRVRTPSGIRYIKGGRFVAMPALRSGRRTQMAKAKAKSGCKRVRTPSGMRYMKGGRFVKKSRC